MNFPYVEVSQEEIKQLNKVSINNPNHMVINVSYDDQPNDIADAFSQIIQSLGYKVIIKGNDDHPHLYYEMIKNET